MPLKFCKHFISHDPYESAAFIDVNGDGILDIVTGAFWYEGPDFRQKHFIGPVRAEGEYYDDFSTIALDINGNGRPDTITGGWWGNTIRWRENPGDPDKTWPEHIIAETGNVESTRAWDIDGDGRIEIVPNTPNSPLVVYKLIVDDQGKGTGQFRAIQISDQKQGHGLGCGDIAGNGRMDLVLNSGWFEAPEKPWEQEWLWHPELSLSKLASVPILVADVNGDGLNDLIVGGGHEYGLNWWEQVMENGNRSWRRHAIDPFNSQYHDLWWIDIDGDGECEIVTGKRWRAHCGNDPGSRDDYGIYYFKWNGEGFSKQIVCYGPAGETKGLGIFFDMADLTGNGLPDIVAPGKDGLCVFYNEGLE
ncbi:VCBS repeat-containing protein [bacterium]|nr:VCBS repeat-containing protein [bacterium]